MPFQNLHLFESSERFIQQEGGVVDDHVAVADEVLAAFTETIKFDHQALLFCIYLLSHYFAVCLLYSSLILQYLLDPKGIAWSIEDFPD